MSGWLGSGSWVEKSFGPVLSWDLEAVWNWTNNCYLALYRRTI
ncbi:uncharacterized protein RSE6_12160 [Rhynchosporium secalis]|uniref:Uncharacterized protein n=1 Tax=Rhynchosporium secalis TaxID=38038 RepID=A0A1E1MPQ8_RHYSE|nr:uncharacterized protein RSE6_12160 [Rhynchosporium secalis]